MGIILTKAKELDCSRIHDIQIKAFSQLLAKYHDYETNPASEELEDIHRRFFQDTTDYYLISHNGIVVGMLRVCNYGECCRISPVAILPEYQGMGYGKQAVLGVERLYPKAQIWELDTIVQEHELCRFYEKLGYRRTGRIENIKVGMDLTFYEKHV